MSVEQDTSLPLIDVGDSISVVYDSEIVDGVAKALDVQRNAP